MAQEPVIGIDLGTTNSEVAFVFNDTPIVIEDDDRGIMPSCVGIDRNGRLIVGRTARNQAAAFPGDTVLAVKRRMGTDTRYTLGDQEYSPQEISAMILKTLKARAEDAIGVPVKKAVITVPAYFTDVQRQATRDAGRIAGLEVLRIINEPTAAALAYGEAGQDEDRHILIYDLGGGTFDVSIVKIEAGVVEVLASTGDNRLGGEDFDEALVEYLLDHIREHHGRDLADDPVAAARLKSAAETAKMQLSDEFFVRIEEDHLVPDLHLSCEVSRNVFEEMIQPLVEKTMTSVAKALRDAGLSPGRLDKVILVGGSTRIPMVSRMLSDELNIQPVMGIDPDLCVALGAGIQAGREMGKSIRSMLIDITPYTFGTSALGMLDGRHYEHCFVPLIRRNTKLPATRTEAFQTLVDDQAAADINVYQGDSPDALDNILIGTYTFDLSKAPAGSVITLRYDLDLNGILTLEAREKDTGKTINAVLENVFSQSGTGISEAMDKVSALFPGDNALSKESPSTGEPSRPAPGTDAVLPPAIAGILDQAREKLPLAPDEDKDDIINLMEDITEACARNDLDRAGKLAEDLEDILFYIGE
jgi:molecular chaperone DnaK (HSP70)